MLSTTFSYARFSKIVEELTGCGLKNSLILSGLTYKYFNSFRDGNDAPIFTHNDEYMRYFVRQSIKRGCCGSFNQYYKSTFSDEMFNITSKKLDLNAKLYEILDKYFEYENKDRNIIENEYDSQLENYRDISLVEKSQVVSDKPSKLPIHEKLQNRDLDNVIMDFDVTSLYPSAMCDEKSVFSKIESGLAFKTHLNDIYVETFNIQSFNQDGNAKTIIKTK